MDILYAYHIRRFHLGLAYTYLPGMYIQVKLSAVGFGFGIVPVYISVEMFYVIKPYQTADAQADLGPCILHMKIGSFSLLVHYLILHSSR